MATVLDVYNAAISAARGKGRLSSTSDNTKTAEECNIWYPLVRDQVQEAAYWPSSRRSTRLTLLDTRDFGLDWVEGNAETQYKYSYALPTTCLRPWYLVGFEHFMLSFDGVNDRTILSCNVEDAVLIYAHKNENPAQWTPGQRLATIYALAGHISTAISGDGNMITKNFQLANQIITEARVAAANQRTLKYESTPPMLSERGYADSETRYFYPYGESFTAAAPNG